MIVAGHIKNPKAPPGPTNDIVHWTVDRGQPGLDGPGKGSVGWTRMYCLTKTTKVKDAAYKLIYYLGGLDEKGEPYTAKFWFLNRGLGFTYKALGNDPEVRRVYLGENFNMELQSGRWQIPAE